MGQGPVHGARRRLRDALVATGLASAALAASAAPALTPVETAWLDLATPVLGYALQQKLPLDIVVQPVAKAGDPPLALGYAGNRCKLVLSMRGNPAAQATLDAIEPDLLGPAVEAMTAHELGHCWRYVHGEWHAMPAGFTAAAAIVAPTTTVREDERDADARLGRLRQEMEATRREEGYADLVGLAWTARRHPEAYARVYAWVTRLREREPVAGGHHDTRDWLRLAGAQEAFDATLGSPFEAAAPLWRRGLPAD